MKKVDGKYRLYEFQGYYIGNVKGGTAPIAGLTHYIDLTQNELEQLYKIGLPGLEKERYYSRESFGEHLDYEGHTKKGVGGEDIIALSNRDKFVTGMFNLLKSEKSDKLYIKIHTFSGKDSAGKNDKNEPLSIWRGGYEEGVNFFEIDFTGSKSFNDPSNLDVLFRIYAAVLEGKSVRVAKTPVFTSDYAMKTNYIVEFNKLGSQAILKDTRKAGKYIAVPIIGENTRFTEFIENFFKETGTPTSMGAGGKVMHSYIFHTTPHTFFTLYRRLSNDDKYIMLKTVDFRELYSSKPSGSDFNKFKDKYLDDDFNLKNKDKIKVEKAVELFERMLISSKDENGAYQLGTYNVETCNIHAFFTKESLRWHSVHRKLSE